MNNNVKLNMQKKIEYKKEIEKLSNKSLTVFTVALFCEVILMFLASALSGTGSYWSSVDDFVCVTSLVSFIAFAVMTILYFYLKKVNTPEVAKSVLNWGFVLLAVSIGAFVISAPTILPILFGMVGLVNLGGALAVKMVRFSGPAACYILMTLVALYVIFIFVYYNIKAKNIKKSK